MNGSRILIGLSHTVFVCQEVKTNAQQPQQPIPLLDCADGLANLASKKYKEAAKHFLKCQFDSCDFPEVRSTP